MMISLNSRIKVSIDNAIHPLTISTLIHKYNNGVAVQLLDINNKPTELLSVSEVTGVPSVRVTMANTVTATLGTSVKMVLWESTKIVTSLATTDVLSAYTCNCGAKGGIQITGLLNAGQVDCVDIDVTGNTLQLANGVIIQGS